MLTNLTINNFAIIDRLEVEFGPGFNVLTGETGAGKSIIMDAVGLLLGDRARPDLVRAGSDEATVEALFDAGGRPEFKALLDSAGLPEGDELIVRRIVSRAGRSRAYVNGAMVTLNQLQPLAEKLVAICGQHEHQTLMQRDAHLTLLDQFGAREGLLRDYQAAYRRLRQSDGELERLTTAERDRQQRLDFLRHQSLEIEAADLQSGEDEELDAERLLLQNAERLSSVTQGSYDALYGADGAACELLGRVADELETVQAVDPQLGGLAEAVRQSLYGIEDVSVQLRNHLGQMSFEPGRQEAVEDRLNQLSMLKRKYAPQIAEIIDLKVAIDREIAQLENAEAARDALLAAQKEQQRQVTDAGTELTTHRRQVADRLVEAMKAELTDLAMSGARFEVRLTPLEQPALNGAERVEFFLAPNPGEGLMPLGRIASGGELSRIMLALKRVAPDVAEVPTIIFDEVDAGIGGVTATAVGRKLHGVSRKTQVLCVTHLPQVAAFADRHFQVAKHEERGRTRTTLESLSGEQRVEEMARMLSGAQVTEQTLVHARELISSPGAE